MKRVLIFDTSVLCCFLRIPGKETCGGTGDRWTYERITNLVNEELRAGATFVLPMATLIETGNHAAQAPRQRFESASGLADLMKKVADAVTPWAAFTEQAELWGSGELSRLADEWPTLAAGGTSIGDATIKDVAEWYARAGMKVEIVTGDAGLRAYQPIEPPLLPRRRRGSS